MQLEDTNFWLFMDIISQLPDISCDISPMHFSNKVQDKGHDHKYNYLPITRSSLIADKRLVLKLTVFWLNIYFRWF